MIKINFTYNIRLALLILGLMMLLNGCVIIDIAEESDPLFQVFDRSLYESLRGVY